MADPKAAWPELVGLTGEEAKAKILQERPELTVEIKPELGPCTMDYREDRVRIFVNNDGKVVGHVQTG